MCLGANCSTVEISQRKLLTSLFPLFSGAKFGALGTAVGKVSMRKVTVAATHRF